MKKLLLISLILVSISSCYADRWREIHRVNNPWDIDFWIMNVPHGWLIKNTNNGAINFYPDEKHEWKI